MKDRRDASKSALIKGTDDVQSFVRRYVKAMRDRGQQAGGQRDGIAKESADSPVVGDGSIDDVRAVISSLSGDDRAKILARGRTEYKDLPSRLAGRSVAYDCGKPVGFADVWGVYGDGRVRPSPSITVAVSPDARGRGVAGMTVRDAVRKVIERVRAEKGPKSNRLRRFVWRLHNGNDASAAAAAKAGFTEQEFKRPHGYRQFTLDRGEAEKRAYAGMSKSAASKLRALLNAGKLTAGQISRFRDLGMLPSRERYVEGAKKMLKSKLEKIFAHAKRRGISLTVRTGVPRGESVHGYSYSWDNEPVHGSFGVSAETGEPNSLFLHEIRHPEAAKHTLELPGKIGHNAGGVHGKFDTSKMGLHDIVTANHELDEYLGFWRGGGPTYWHWPTEPLAYLQTHMPGVIPKERRLYERLARQLGVQNPDWRRFRLGGREAGRFVSRGDYPNEVALSALTPKDERALRRLIADVPVKGDELAVLKGVADGTQVGGTPFADVADPFRSFYDASRSFTGRAADLAHERGLKKLERYLRSDPVAYTWHGGIPRIASSNYDVLKGAWMRGAPLWSSKTGKDLWAYYMGGG